MTRREVSDISARWVLSQLFSLLVTGFVLISVLSTYVGLTGLFHALASIAWLASAVGLRYAAVYHRFSKTAYKAMAVGVLSIGFLATGAMAMESLLDVVSPGNIRSVLYPEVFDLYSGAPRPDQLVTVLLVLSGVAIFGGSLTKRNFTAYPKPSGLREVASSPLYFGIVCTVFGLWAVLFVGISIQRVVIIAPIFEELLKFGVALSVGSVLFDRSLPARIGVALVVGSTFGLVEHATTYPMEAETIHLFRTLFHATTTVLSVSVYTAFEAERKYRLQWIAPAYSMILHFFYNTFAVVSTVVSVSIYGSPFAVVTLVYGSAAVLLAMGLLLLLVVDRDVIVSIHAPIEHVLSDFV